MACKQISFLFPGTTTTAIGTITGYVTHNQHK